MAERHFRLWASACSHMGSDLRHGRESFAEAMRQSEHGGEGGGPAFDWDAAVHLGDFSGSQTPPGDEEGIEVARQLGSGRRHSRELIYTIAGNHDASGPEEPQQWWIRKWVDPVGEHPATSGVHPERMRYPVTGTWERYEFRVGNILFLMMSDRNDGGPPVGRGPVGGYPAGAVSSATFEWWRDRVEANSDCIIVSAHHHMLKETTVASGPWEGYKRGADGRWMGELHGYFEDGGPEGASYLYFLDQTPDAQAFESYLADHEAAIDLWLGGHTHTLPDHVVNGRSHIERKWGVGFVNVAALTRYHGPERRRHLVTPMSRLLTFTEGSAEVEVTCYLHTSQFAPQGWYEPATRRLPLRHPFTLGA